MSTVLNVSTLILFGVLYIILTGMVFIRRGFPGRAIIPLLVYLILSLTWVGLLTVQLIRPDLLTEEWIVKAPAFFLVISFGLFFTITMLVIHPGKHSWWSWLPGAVWLVLLILYDLNKTPLRFMPMQDALSFLPRTSDIWWIPVIGWTVLFLFSIFAFWRVLRTSSQTYAKNQVYFWFAAFMLVAVGDLTLITSNWWISCFACASGAYTAVRVYTNNHLPPIRQIIRQGLGFSMITLVIIGMFLFYWFYIPALQGSPGNPGALELIIIAIILALNISGAWVITQRAVSRLMPATRYNMNRILRECSQSISNVMTPELLAAVTIRLISEAIHIQRGFLFVVEQESKEGNGDKVYQLCPAGGIGESPSIGTLYSASPTTEFFLDQRKPLVQYDLMTSPCFNGGSTEEIEWFKSLGLEIYVPIYSRDEWIGLIGLGAKSSGTPYYDEDTLLLSTLADQMAVALQNIRLMESLTRVNNDFRRAYTAMEQSNRHLQIANQQLEKIDHTKSDFISIASHELRTPLTVMRGYNEMLMEDSKIKENSYHYKLVKGIHSGMLRLHEIVESMLDMASIDARSLQLHTEPITLQVQLSLVCELFTDSLKERNIDLCIENLRGLPIIEADPEAIRKIFTQLIQNAIKYTPDGGSVAINGCTIPPGEMDLPDGGVEILVSDTGIGIDPEHLDVIFTKFYQTGEIVLHSTGKTKFRGAGPGLGLAIVRGIVEAHGGKIWAESRGYDEETCPGSLFHVLLPIHQNHQSLQVA